MTLLLSFPVKKTPLRSFGGTPSTSTTPTLPRSGPDSSTVTHVPRYRGHKWGSDNERDPRRLLRSPSSTCSFPCRPLRPSALQEKDDSGTRSGFPRDTQVWGIYGVVVAQVSWRRSKADVEVGVSVGVRWSRPPRAPLVTTETKPRKVVTPTLTVEKDTSPLVWTSAPSKSRWTPSLRSPVGGPTGVVPGRPRLNSGPEPGGLATGG